MGGGGGEGGRACRRGVWENALACQRYSPKLPFVYGIIPVLSLLWCLYCLRNYTVSVFAQVFVLSKE